MKEKEMDRVKFGVQEKKEMVPGERCYTRNEKEMVPGERWCTRIDKTCPDCWNQWNEAV